VNAGFRLHELGADPNALVRLADAAFQHIAHAQFATDPFHVDAEWRGVREWGSEND